MKLIVGLGNPGKEYEHTRHNMGFMAVDEIAKSLNIKIDKKKFNGLYCEILKNGEKVLLMKPQSYINLSGDVIRQYMDYFKIDITDLLIICDDMDTEFGKIKLKYKGGSAGHNGLKNIELNLKTQDYKRIKIGISRDNIIDTKNYVLGKVKDNEIINLFPQIFNDYLEMSFDNLMNKYN